jgi:hypothetical protein
MKYVNISRQNKIHMERGIFVVHMGIPPVRRDARKD